MKVKIEVQPDAEYGFYAIVKGESLTGRAFGKTVDKAVAEAKKVYKEELSANNNKKVWEEEL